ncbi:MAG: hypothetical protein WAW37_07165 [Syntrophobacteraceae bacterium]
MGGSLPKVHLTNFDHVPEVVFFDVFLGELGKLGLDFYADNPVGAACSRDSVPVGTGSSRDSVPVGAASSRDFVPVGAASSRDAASAEFFLPVGKNKGRHPAAGPEFDDALFGLDPGKAREQDRVKGKAVALFFLADGQFSTKERITGEWGFFFYQVISSLGERGFMTRPLITFG